MTTQIGLELLREYDNNNKYNYNGCLIDEEQYDELNFKGMGYSIFFKENYQRIQENNPSIDHEEMPDVLYSIWYWFSFEERNEYYQKC